MLNREMYDYVGVAYNGFVPVRKGTKWGYVDAEGNEITECKFDSIGNFDKGYADVVFEGERGFIDEQGRLYSCQKKPVGLWCI